MSDSQKFNTNARLFNKDQLNKLLSELDIPVNKTKPVKKKISLEEKKTAANVRQPQGSVEDILRGNFIEDEE